MNDVFAAMTGYPAAALRGRRHGFLHGEKTDAKKIMEWQKGARPAEPLAGEGFLRRKDGTAIYAALNFSVIPAARGQPAHVVAVYRDTTEKRRLQEALVHAQRLDAVGRLAGGVAHDFNNLLSVINGYSQILASQLADRPQVAKGIEVIYRAGQKAAVLTRQLLAFGRREPLKTRVVDLNEFVRSNADIFARLLDDRGQLELALAEKVGRVRVNPAQFQQVLLNLILNARDALRKDGRVVIRTARREVSSGLNRRATDAPPGHYVGLAISDNGVGMDESTQRQIFEPYFTTKPESEGTGLGLSLAYGVVQQSGGFITVRSKLGVGSAFEILLPESTEPASAAERTALIEPLPATQGHESVLLVEEDDVVRKMVTGILTADGYQVVAVKTPAAARRGDPVAAQAGPAVGRRAHRRWHQAGPYLAGRGTRLAGPGHHDEEQSGFAALAAGQPARLPAKALRPERTFERPRASCWTPERGLGGTETLPWRWRFCRYVQAGPRKT